MIHKLLHVLPIFSGLSDCISFPPPFFYGKLYSLKKYNNHNVCVQHTFKKKIKQFVIRSQFYNLKHNFFVLKCTLAILYRVCNIYIITERNNPFMFLICLDTHLPGAFIEGFQSFWHRFCLI